MLAIYSYLEDRQGLKRKIAFYYVSRIRLVGTLALEMCNAAAFENKPYPGRHNLKNLHTA
jgi:hypothetical protein